MNTVKLLIPAFNVDKQLKSTIASTMWTDANDFLHRSNIILQDLETGSFAYLSKIYVDILMAIESDLKCIIIGLSLKSEIPEESYNIIRGHSHKIDKLYDEARKRAFNRIKLLNKKDENQLKMNYTEKQILEKSKKILKDLQKEFYDEINIESTWYQKERPVRGNEKMTQSCWVTSIHQPLFGGSSVFLTISDETGEPKYIQNKHSVEEIQKDSVGNYF